MTFRGGKIIFGEKLVSWCHCQILKIYISLIPVVEGVISTLKSSKLSEDLLLSVTGTCSLTVDPAHQSYSKLEDVWTRLSDIYGLNAKERIKYSSHVALDIMSCLAYTSHAEVQNLIEIEYKGSISFLE